MGHQAGSFCPFPILLVPPIPFSGEFLGVFVGAADICRGCECDGALPNLDPWWVNQIMCAIPVLCCFRVRVVLVCALDADRRTIVLLARRYRGWIDSMLEIVARHVDSHTDRVSDSDMAPLSGVKFKQRLLDDLQVARAGLEVAFEHKRTAILMPHVRAYARGACGLGTVMCADKELRAQAMMTAASMQSTNSRVSAETIATALKIVCQIIVAIKGEENDLMNIVVSHARLLPL